MIAHHQMRSDLLNVRAIMASIVLLYDIGMLGWVLPLRRVHDGVLQFLPKAALKSCFAYVAYTLIATIARKQGSNSAEAIETEYIQQDECPQGECHDSQSLTLAKKILGRIAIRGPIEFFPTLKFTSK